MREEPLIADAGDPDAAPGASVVATVGGDAVTAVIAGEVDVATGDQVERALTDAARSGLPVHVDLAAVTFFSARGVAALLAARAVATRAGGSLVVTSASRPAHRVLEITGVLDELRPAPPAQGPDLTNPQESVADG